MSPSLPSHARVVVVGGGIIGCSVAYHLAHLGWSEVVVLERKQLTCGTTWHAAGLVPQLRATHNMTRLAQYTGQLYRQLEAETGQATGFRQNGSLTVAASPGRFEEIQRSAAMGRCFGVDVEVLNPRQAAELWPLMDHRDLSGAIYIPADGTTNPVDTTAALAKGARQRGVQIFEHTRVTDILRQGERVAGVATDRGVIHAEYVVNCAGMWARQVGQMAGVAVPLHAAEHFYIVTEAMAGLKAGLPTLRDLDGYSYYKEDAGKLLIGAFEPEAKPWGMAGIPEDFCFDQLPDDWEHFEPVMEKALARIPTLADAGIQLFFNGPESFTPDDRYLLGEAPTLQHFFVAAGFNSIGIQSAGGAGKVLAEWIVHGQPPMDLSDVDIRRSHPFQANGRYLLERTRETLGLLYAMHWPHRQVETARGVRRSPLHDRLVAHNACFGEVAGWERPNWYAPPGVEPRYGYSYGRQNWFAYSAAEHRGVREGVGLFDQSSFGKWLLQGRDACRVLNQICANDIDVPPGQIVYTPWLNPKGGIEADLTVTRLGEDRFFIVTGAGSQIRDGHWLARHIRSDACAVAVDVTSGYAVLGVMGPRSRELLATLTPADLSNAAFPFATAQEIELGYGLARAARITYVGELGWELYIPCEFAQDIYDRINAAGQDFGLVHAGYHALFSLRIEKAYRHWGHDVTDEDTPLEAGLGFAVAFDKPGGFIGRDALLRQRAQGRPRRRLVQFLLEDPEPLLYHDEPIYRDGALVGRTTSGMYGHTLGGAVALGYVCHEAGVDKDFIHTGQFEIEVAGRRHPARASLRPLYDPSGTKIRA
ncbi:MAG: FAD-dependent oxidoreductase [Candidatus Competibacterales bacterium]